MSFSIRGRAMLHRGCVPVSEVHVRLRKAVQHGKPSGARTDQISRHVITAGRCVIGEREGGDKTMNGRWGVYQALRGIGRCILSR